MRKYKNIIGIMLMIIVVLIPLYIFFLIPQYKACVASGTDKGICIHIYLVRW